VVKGGGGVTFVTHQQVTAAPQVGSVLAQGLVGGDQDLEDESVLELHHLRGKLSFGDMLRCYLARMKHDPSLSVPADRGFVINQELCFETVMEESIERQGTSRSGGGGGGWGNGRQCSRQCTTRHSSRRYSLVAKPESH